tara:strand:+ start:15644 stop:16732 length:1089 start_codon:yes stop_codon:yes gene_type:complete
VNVPYLDLSVKDVALKARLMEAVGTVLDHGRVIMGPEMLELETRVAAYCGRRFCIGVSSGSDALYVALRALDVGPGDEIITTPMSWVATTNAIVLTGATPVYVDIAPDLNIDPGRVEAAISSKTRAIVPVHYTGKLCEMDDLVHVAEERGIPIIEDAAQAFGAEDGKGRRAGSFGHLACFSFNSMKVFHSYGEAGAVLTDDEELVDRVQSLRYAGTRNREDCHYPSLNFRMQTLQAALLLVELDRLDQIIDRRREIARTYRRSLDGLVTCPEEPDGWKHVFYTFTIQSDSRDELQRHLQSDQIETKIHHSLLMPHQTAYRGKFPLDIPVAEKTVRRILSIPNHEKMTDGQIDHVKQSVSRFF